MLPLTLPGSSREEKGPSPKTEVKGFKEDSVHRWSYSGTLQGSKKIRFCLVQAKEELESWRNVSSPWQPPKHRSQAISRPSPTQRNLPKVLSSSISVFPEPPPTPGPAGCWAMLSQQVSTRALMGSGHSYPLYILLHPEEFQIYSTP